MNKSYDVYMCRDTAFEDEIMSYVGKHDISSHTPEFFRLVKRASVAGQYLTVHLSKGQIINKIDLNKKGAQHG
jgi:hypothetical protein